MSSERTSEMTMLSSQNCVFELRMGSKKIGANEAMRDGEELPLHVNLHLTPLRRRNLISTRR